MYHLLRKNYFIYIYIYIFIHYIYIYLYLYIYIYTFTYIYIYITHRSESRWPNSCAMIIWHSHVVFFMPRQFTSLSVGKLVEVGGASGKLTRQVGPPFQNCSKGKHVWTPAPLVFPLQYSYIPIFLAKSKCLRVIVIVPFANNAQKYH